jgi:hypothetical protein
MDSLDKEILFNGEPKVPSIPDIENIAEPDKDNGNDLLYQEKANRSSLDSLIREVIPEKDLKKFREPIKKQDHIKPAPPKKPKAEPMPEKAQKPKPINAKANILIVSNEENARHKMVSALTGGDYIKHQIGNMNLTDIYMGVSQFKGGHSLSILGISVEREFTPVVDFLSSRLLGYVLLLNLDDVKNWNYYGYLVTTLKSKLNIPSIILAYTESGQTAVDKNQIQNALGLGATDKLEILTEINNASAKRAIFALFGVNA